MKTKFIILTLLISFSLNAHITKNHWLVGGSGSFSFNNSNITSNIDGSSDKFNSFTLELSPNFGYFLVDKFALGLRGTYKNNFSTEKNSAPTFTEISIDPFLRYYFLNSDRPLNIFSELSYKFFLNNPYNNNMKTFGAKSGIVYFVNDIIGYELALNYSNTTFDNALGNKGSNNIIMLALGIQVHLEKQK